MKGRTRGYGRLVSGPRLPMRGGEVRRDAAADRRAPGVVTDGQAGSGGGECILGQNGWLSAQTVCPFLFLLFSFFICFYFLFLFSIKVLNSILNMM